MKRLALTALALLVLLTGCWQGTGKVIRREYHPAWTTITTQCHLSGKTTICIPVTQYYPPSWSLLIRDGKDSSEHWVSVNEHDYNTHQINDTFTN